MLCNGAWNLFHQLNDTADKCPGDVLVIMCYETEQLTIVIVTTHNDLFWKTDNENDRDCR